MNRSGCKRLATEMSSSIASQCTPFPPPINSQAARCLGVASKSRGNQTNGAETVRPSARTKFSVSFVQDTSTAVISLLSTKVPMPLLQEGILFAENDSTNLSEFVTPEASIVGQCHRSKPKLRVPASVCHTNVWRLTPLHTEEKEPVTTNPEHYRHKASLPYTVEAA